MSRSVTAAEIFSARTDLCHPVNELLTTMEDFTMGEHGAYAHRYGGPLSSRPLSPCACKGCRPERSGLKFLKLSSRGRWRIVSGVCRECSKSIHCSKESARFDSHLARTPRRENFTRPSVRTRRGNLPAPPGRPPRGGAKVAWFRYSVNT